MKVGLGVITITFQVAIPKSLSHRFVYAKHLEIGFSYILAIGQPLSLQKRWDAPIKVENDVQSRVKKSFCSCWKIWEALSETFLFTLPHSPNQISLGEGEKTLHPHQRHNLHSSPSSSTEITAASTTSLSPKKSPDQLLLLVIPFKKSYSHIISLFPVPKIDFLCNWGLNNCIFCQQNKPQLQSSCAKKWKESA